MPHIQIYDTTLRDGTQGEGVNFSLQDKLLIARKLDAPQITDTMRFFLGHPESSRPRGGGSR